MVSTYPEWLSNIVPVFKPRGRVRVCIDYRDLNRAILKDSFVVLFFTYSYTILPSLNCTPSWIASPDTIKSCLQKKTHHSLGTLCYRCLPFALINVGVIYQRAMMSLFHDMVHKEIEVYINDIIVKSKKNRGPPTPPQATI